MRIATLVLVLGVALAACTGESKSNVPTSPTPAPGDARSDSNQIDHEVFSLGVASGDVTASSAVLWTRASGVDSVTAEITSSASFDDARTQSADVSADSDYTAKLRMDGLSAGTRYYYRFRVASGVSETGTFATAPEPSAPAAVRFVFSGDSDGTRQANGAPVFNNFDVLARAAADNPDFFLYFGDTIYGDRSPPATTVEGYRAKYRQNREYPALANLLRQTPMYNTWDDHEVENDFSGTTEDRSRLEAGLQAFHEYMPIDGGDTGKMYRTFRWGKDVELFLLDERSFRSGEAKDACARDGRPDPLPGGSAPSVPPPFRSGRTRLGLPADVPPGCIEALDDPSRTMLGEEQKSWLKDELDASDATWKVIVNEVPIQQMFALPYDRWEGYAAERHELLSFIRDSGIKNVVFVTTDFHGNVFGPVKDDLFIDPAPVAYEAVTGPIATFTVHKELLGSLGEDTANAFGLLLKTVVGADCVQLDSYSYSLVEVDPASRTMTITAKDDAGTVPCTRKLIAE